MEHFEFAQAGDTIDIVAAHNAQNHVSLFPQFVSGLGHWHGMCWGCALIEMRSEGNRDTHTHTHMHCSRQLRTVPVLVYLKHKYLIALDCMCHQADRLKSSVSSACTAAAVMVPPTVKFASVWTDRPTVNRRQMDLKCVITAHRGWLGLFGNDQARRTNGHAQ